MVRLLTTVILINISTFCAYCTDVEGDIKETTVWDNTEEAYNFTGDVNIWPNVKLIISPKATINGNDFKLNLAGELLADGSETEPKYIIFNKVNITTIKSKSNFLIDLNY